MNRYKKGFLTILSMIAITGAALAYMGTREPSGASSHVPAAGSGGKDIIAIHSSLTQEKVMKGSDGIVSVALTISAGTHQVSAAEDVQPVDLVVVLDRSGSMSGQKIGDAKRAVIHLLDQLSPQDRIAVVTYSNGVQVLSPLVQVNDASRENLTALINRINPAGGTNLGGGLKNGIDILRREAPAKRQRKVILISDGLANHGITSPAELGALSAHGSEHNLAVSTVGVGYDFNEVLMTAIADHGAGNYYFLENPQDFVTVFEQEFKTARTVAAGGAELQIRLRDGLQLVGAGGFPIRIENGVALIRPGNILSGQQRTIFLSYRVPTDLERTFSLGSIELHYQHDGNPEVAVAPEELTIACVQNQQEVLASIDETAWTEQVLKEDYSRLKENVAAAIRIGSKDEALQAIEEYEARTTTINSSVDSDKVSNNLEKDVQALRSSVQTTFAGSPAAVAEKKKQQAKSLQYESYQIRRDKK